MVRKKGKGRDRFRVAIDIGGTFTDFVLLDVEDGHFWIWKIPTTPTDLSSAAISGLESLLLEQDVEIDEVEGLVHATTIGTNAIIENKGAKTGLITTKGFRDILEIGREWRYDLHDLHLKKPKPLIPRYLRKEVTERATHRGEVLADLSEDEVLALVQELVDEGVGSVAISLLHAYVYPDHELRIGEIISQSFPNLAYSLSHQVANEIREYERTSTVVIDAFIKPLVDRYLERLEDRLSAKSFIGNVSIMSSNGGALTLEQARGVPVRLIESGPAAGAIAASSLARSAGEESLIFLDMGGTTAKIGVVDEGQVRMVRDFEVSRQHRFKPGSGYPVKAPSVELVEIGAGGGSIAWIDELGLLKVGPESAGAEPGPACYGSGGSRPTVTDADLLLGYLNSEFFLGGRMKLDRESAIEAIRRECAEPLGMEPIEVAQGICDVINEDMANVARMHIAYLGMDPRLYTMFAFGGAGPVHAYEIARRLHIRRVVCPLGAGVTAALGCVLASPTHELSATYRCHLNSIDWERLNGLWQDLQSQAQGLLEQARVPPEQIAYARMAEMRFAGQGYEITVTIPSGRLSQDSLPQMEEAFRQAYSRIYRHFPEGVPIEALTWRLNTVGPGLNLTPVIGNAGCNDSSDQVKGTRNAYFREIGRFEEATVYDRYRLAPGKRLSGPAIIEERESTVVVGPHATFSIDEGANLIIELGGE